MIYFENNTLKFESQLTKKEVPKLFAQLNNLEISQDCSAISFANITDIDTSGVAFIDCLLEKFERKIRLIDIDKSVQKSLETFTAKNLPKEEIPEEIGFFEMIGSAIYDWSENAVKALYLTADIFYWSVVSLWNRKGQRAGSIIQQSVLIGVNALPIVSLLSLIIGLILALQSAAQLKQFGANIYIADLLAISMVREMGPMMTAIIIAGRSGSSIASEIATMKVTEEIDALKMMAINPIRFVVVPKFFAMSLCVPLLVSMSIMIGIFGGMIVAISYLGLSPQSYIAECLTVLAVKDFVISLTKSLFFAWVIVIIGAFYGFQVQGGAEGVGRSTTQAVVASIFAVIVWDALFSLVYMV